MSVLPHVKRILINQLLVMFGVSIKECLLILNEKYKKPRQSSILIKLLLEMSTINQRQMRE